MAQVDDELKDLYRLILDKGEERDTRTGSVKSIWKYNMEFDLEKEFPAVTSKKLAWKATVGELIWFLSKSDSIRDLKHYTHGDANSNKWTIWADDAERWGDGDFVGNLYPQQWRNQNDESVFGDRGIDQIQNLINRLNNEPQRRDHIVMAWNAYDIENDLTALKPCHLGFQCYVTNDGRLNLHWWQRSVDSFLGLPMNIASYALLTHLLARWTGLRVGRLSCDLGDIHIYDNHMKAVETFLINPKFKPCQLQLPEGTETLESTLNLTALDFEKSLIGYESMGVVKAPLSVGK